MAEEDHLELPPEADLNPISSHLARRRLHERRAVVRKRAAVHVAVRQVEEEGPRPRKVKPKVVPRRHFEEALVSVARDPMADIE